MTALGIVISTALAVAVVFLFTLLFMPDPSIDERYEEPKR